MLNNYLQSLGKRLGTIFSFKSKLTCLYQLSIYLIQISSGIVAWPGIGNDLFEQWRKSPDHNRNMLTSGHTCAGVGIFGDGTTFYGTQIFSNDC